GRFLSDSGIQVLAVYKDGSMRVAHHFDAAAGKYTQEWKSTPMPQVSSMKPPLLATYFRNNQSEGHVLLIDSRGRVVWLRNLHLTGDEIGFEASVCSWSLPHVRQMAAWGSMLFWMNTAGNVYWMALDDRRAPDSGHIVHADPNEKMVVGNFSGQSGADLII